MLRTNHQGYQTFSDGWGTSYEITDRRVVKTRQAVIHFQEASVGERRFWDAQVNDVSIVRAVRVPEDSLVDMGDLFEIGDKRYEVVQKDRKDDRRPASWLLSLRSVTIDYRKADK